MCEDAEQDPLPDFDEMSINRLRYWAEGLADKVHEHTLIKSLLVGNCKEGRAIHDAGARYDEHFSLFDNLVSILEKLNGEIEELNSQ